MTVADRVLDALGEGVRGQAGPLLAPLVTALTAEVEPVDAIVSDAPEAPGWARLLDLDVTTAPAWLGQLTGAVVPAGTDPEVARAFVRESGGWRRGTPRALRGAVRATLAGGTGAVDLIERDGSPYRVRVIVYAGQVVDLAATTRAAQAHKPAGVVLVLDVRTGGDYAHLTSAHAGTYAALHSTFATYGALAAHVPAH